jgi:hypothetical protein
MRYRVGAPIETRWDGMGTREDWVRSVDARVRGSIQHGLDHFAHKPQAATPSASSEGAEGESAHRATEADSESAGRRDATRR